MGCVLLRGFLTASSPLGAEELDVRIAQHRGDAQPLSPLKHGELTKMDREKEDHHIAAHFAVLSHAETPKKPFKMLSPR